MKCKVTGLVLAGVAAVTLTLSAFAASTEDTGVQPPMPPVVPPVEEVEETEPAKPVSPFCLDGEFMETLVYQAQNNVYYITVESFVTAMNREAMVEQEDGVVTVTASSLSGVVDVKEETEDDPWSTPTGEEQESGAQEANVEEEILTLAAQSGACYAVANGRYLYVEDGVILVEDKVALPIRVLAEVFNLTVGYDSETGTVQLNRQEGAEAFLESGDTYYNADSLYWLSRIIYSESGNQSMSGKIAVGNVVMNRVESPKFPNTIYDVIFQKNQFSPASSGSIYRTPNEQSVIAAKLVLDGAEVLDGVLFFNRVGMNTYAARTRTYVATIGAHTFYA